MDAVGCVLRAAPRPARKIALPPELGERHRRRDLGQGRAGQANRGLRTATKPPKEKGGRQRSCGGKERVSSWQTAGRSPRLLA